MAFSFPIGKARQRVTIERATEVTDGYGQIAYQWATLADVWAKVETASGRERVIAEQLRATYGCEVDLFNRAASMICHDE